VPRYTSKIFCNAVDSLAVGAAWVVFYLPKGILTRVECYIVSQPTSYPDTITGVLDEVYLQNLGDLSTSLHLLSQEPLTGRGVVAWQGKFYTENGSHAVAAYFTALPANAKCEMNVQMDVEQ
jgi:hypothetical protein